MALGLLASIGIPFITDLVSKYGEKAIVAGVEKATGIDISSKELTPEERQRILDAEAKIREIDFKELKLTYDDKNSAREMQGKALSQDDTFSKRFIYYFAMFWSVVAGGFIWAVFAVDIPEANMRLVDTILGFIMGTVITTIVQFFYGSSRGSKDKTDNLVDVIKQLK